VAPLDADQDKVGVTEIPVAALAGAVKLNAPGAFKLVVNDKIADAADPALFLATTFQKYGVPPVSELKFQLVEAVLPTSGGLLAVPK
jgi:hypothetical protein